MSNALLDNNQTKPNTASVNAPVLPVVRTENGHLALLHWGVGDAAAPVPASLPTAPVTRRVRIDWHLTGIVTLMLMSGIAGIASLLGMG